MVAVFALDIVACLLVCGRWRGYFVGGYLRRSVRFLRAKISRFYCAPSISVCDARGKPPRHRLIIFSSSSGKGGLLNHGDEKHGSKVTTRGFCINHSSDRSGLFLEPTTYAIIDCSANCSFHVGNEH